MRSGSLMFTSESVAESHPDKIAAQISDRILDAFLARDPDARVACETLFNDQLVLGAGQFRAQDGPIFLDFETAAERLVRQSRANIGWTCPEKRWAKRGTSFATFTTDGLCFQRSATRAPTSVLAHEETEPFRSDRSAINSIPHVAQNTTNRRLAIDRRTTRHPGYTVSQRIRKRLEEIFGWAKTVGPLRQ